LAECNQGRTQEFARGGGIIFFTRGGGQITPGNHRFTHSPPPLCTPMNVLNKTNVQTKD